MTNKETGKVSPVITSETEHIYTGKAIEMTARMKHIIFKLYRGSTLIDMQTVIVTTDASIMKVAYDTRFEVNEKEILAHASRISQTEKDITDLRITADGISANISKQSGIIQNIINGAGRNLLLKTNQGSNNWQYVTNSTTIVAIKANSIENDTPYQPISEPFHLTTSDRTDSTYEVFLYALRPELIKAGEKYTLTFKISNLSARLCHFEMFAQIANSTSLSPLTDAPHFTEIVESGEQTLSVTMTAKESGDVNGTQMIYIGIVTADLNQWTELRIWDLKLEKGETATAYSAAPEDSADYLYSTLNTAIDITAEGIRAEVTKKIGESEDRITNKYTSLIEQRADEILAQVESWDDELGASISEIRQTANNISLKVDGFAGYKNIITGNGTGQGWVASSNDGAFGEIIPSNGVYLFANDTTSPKYLRTPLFTLLANTKYTLSFKTTAISADTNGLTVAIKHGDTADTLTTRIYEGSLNGVSERKTFTFETGNTNLENAFVEFVHNGNKAGVTQSTVFNISEVILEIGEVAHPYVEDATGLLSTGIDIYNRRIVFTADNIIFKSNNGEQSMFMDENGRILAKFINVEELRVNHLVAGDEMGQRVEIDPTIKAVEIYNEDNELCTTINGESHNRGIEDLYGESQEGTINTWLVNENGYAISNGNYTLNGTSTGNTETINIYSQVWPTSPQSSTATPTDSPTSAIMGAGNIFVYAYSSGYTESSTGSGSGAMPSVEQQSFASGYVYLYLEVADDINFSLNKKSWLIHSTGASASALSNAGMGAYDPLVGGSSGNYYPADYNDNKGSQLVDGKSAKATKKGFCRIRLSIIARANHKGSYVNVKWGSDVTGGRNLTATWKNEFYISNFFANGFCLGIRKDKYIIAYKDRNDDMHFEMEEEGFGLKFSKMGIQAKHHNGNWMPMPMLVWKAKIRRYNTSGSYSDKYLIENQKSFNSDTISWANTLRTEVNGHIHINIPFPASWAVMGITDANTIVNLTGYGDDKMKGTLVSINSTSMTVELSDDDSPNDGTLIIELFIL